MTTKKKPGARSARRETAASTGPLMESALREQITKLLAEPMSPRTLLSIAEVAQLGSRQLMLARGDRARPMRHHGMATYGAWSSSLGGTTPDFNTDDGDGEPLAPAPAAETFASKMMREAISAFTASQSKASTPTPMDIFYVAERARSSGNTALADALEAKILGAAAATVMPAPQSVPTLPAATPEPATREKGHHDHAHA